VEITDIADSLAADLDARVVWKAIDEALNAL